MNEARKEDQGKGTFKFNPEISLGDIVLVITLLVPAVVWGVRVESKISVLEYQESQNADFKKDIKETLTRMDADSKAAFLRLEDKLIDRFNKKGDR